MHWWAYHSRKAFQIHCNALRWVLNMKEHWIEELLWLVWCISLQFIWSQLNIIKLKLNSGENIDHQLYEKTWTSTVWCRMELIWTVKRIAYYFRYVLEQLRRAEDFFSHLLLFCERLETFRVYISVDNATHICNPARQHGKCTWYKR